MTRARAAAILGGYVLVFWVVLPVVLLLPYLALERTPRTGVGMSPIAVLGAVVLPCGAGLMLWAARALRVHGHGLPVSHLPPTELVWDGPFAFMRHPLYTGYATMWIGVGMMLGSVAILGISVPVLVAGSTLYSRVEERSLETRFRSNYRAYRREVKPALSPHRLVLWLTGMLVTRLAFDFRVRRDAGGASGGAPGGASGGAVRLIDGPSDRVPRGGCLVVTPHRNYLDPLFVWLTLRRPVRFLTTHDMYRSVRTARLFDRLGSIRVDRYRSVPGAVRRALRLARDGAAVGVFPSGGRSWTGEESYPADFEHLVIRSGVPVVPIALAGTYAAWPRWGAIARRPVRVRVLSPRLITSRDAVREMVRELAAAPLSADVPAPAAPSESAQWSLPGRLSRGITEVLYLCPYCRNAFSLRLSVGRDSLSCVRCGERLTVPDRDTVCSRGGRCRSLAELRARFWGVVSTRSEPLEARGDYWIEHGDRRLDEPFGAVELVATAAGLVIRSARTGALLADIPCREIDAVLIRGCETLQVYSRHRLHTVRVGHGRALALQDALRLRAFGDARVRRRGVTQVVVR